MLGHVTLRYFPLFSAMLHCFVLFSAVFLGCVVKCYVESR